MPTDRSRQRRAGPLRVLMTADAVGGVWTYAIDLAEGLAQQGIETTLALCGPKPSAEQRRAAQQANVDLVDIDAPLDWTARDEGDLRRAGEEVANLAAAVEPDVVHLNSPALAAQAAFDAPVLGVCHSCLATWWEAVKGGAFPADFAWRIGVTGAGTRACSTLVAPSYAFASATARAYDIPLPKVIHNGRRQRPRSAADTEPLVITAGRLWDEGKDVATLDRAAALLDVPFVALGPTEAPDGAMVRFDHLDTPGALPSPSVAGWMDRARVFASAARYEPFGLAVLEAAQAGTALVLSDIPTFRELWDGAAVFVAPGDARGFADAIEMLLERPEAWREAARAARERADRYDMTAFIEGYVAAYQRLTRRRVAA